MLDADEDCPPYSERADAENTMSIMYASVCVVNETAPLMHTKDMHI